MGSMPSFRTIGSRIGTRMVMAAMVSMKQPTNRIRMLASSRNTHLLWVIPSIASVSICAACETVNSHAKMEDADTIKRTDTVISSVPTVRIACYYYVIVRTHSYPM